MKEQAQEAPLQFLCFFRLTLPDHGYAPTEQAQFILQALIPRLVAT
jgi:hypothetical protein